MKRFTVYAGLVFVLFTYQAHSANLYLLTFLEEAPLKGVLVVLDGDDLGDTDTRGSAEGGLLPGQHELVLTANARSYPIDFSSAPDEDVEISITFTDDASEQPVIRIAKYGPNSGAGEGYLTGIITDIAGSPVIGAAVNLVGTQYSASTDDSGVYLMSVPRGLYDITVSYPDYRDIDVSGVRILAGLGVTAGFKLLENNGSGISYDDTIEEVFVLGVFNPVEDSSSIERYATSITNAIDIAQLERFGDSDVASALNRVSGVAVTDSKYATVRGLDGRYVSSTLNGLLMPSTDPQRRDVQLDLFPTSILGGIEIQKSYTPDQLATTTGGAIKIDTRGLPDEKIHKISGSFGYNTDFTGDEIVKYRGSNYDWLGVDSGLRDLPRDVVAATRGGSSLTICDPAIDPIRCTSELDAAQLGVQFQDDYNISTKDALPDVDASWVYGDRLSAGDNEWGYYLALSFDRETSDRGTATLSNPLETVGSYMRSRETTALTGYVVVGYEFGEADEILAKTTVLRSSDDTTRQEQGIEQREDNSISSAVLEWVEREFISQSFSGHHEFDFGAQPHQLDWRLAYSQTDRYEPDRRQYTYFNDSLSTSSFERRWSDLNENSTDFGFDYTLPLEWSNTVITDVKAGVLWSDKDREVEQYRFGIRLGSLNDLDLGIDQDIEQDILPYQNFALDRVRLSANTTDTDSYESQEEIKAYYITSNTDFGEQLSVLFGARFEDFSQQLDYPNQASASNSLDHDDWYPALNLTWRITDEIQLRAGYSETVSYPGLIERSESQSFDPETDDPIFGNPDLRVSTIDNLDLRAEYYFSEDESISLAIFTKEIDSPIERAIPDASGSAARGITFVNQDSAELLGVELDANKNLIDHDEYLLFIGGNLSYIDSEVDLSEDSLRLEGANADGRTLQGQSEWLANFQIGFDHYATEQKFTVLVNYFDDRIFRISRGAATGPEFEEARVLIDFTYEKIFSDSFTIEASIKNLLNEKVEFSQNNSAIESYENGTAIGISLKYEFL